MARIDPSGARHAIQIAPVFPAYALQLVPTATATECLPVALAAPIQPVAIAVPFQPVALAAPFLPVAIAAPFHFVAVFTLGFDLQDPLIDVTAGSGSAISDGSGCVVFGLASFFGISLTPGDGVRGIVPHKGTLVNP